MNRIDRLTAILVHLQGKSRVPIEELEDRYEVSRRTIFRDVKSLMENGVPIGGDAGEGYFIVEGYHLPPVVFNREEAAALLMAAKFVEHNADNATKQQVNDAMLKVRAVLKYADRDFVESLDESVHVRSSFTNMNTSFPDSHLTDIQEALVTNRVVKIEYFSNYKEQTTLREVEPLGLIFYSNRWHLIGYCRLRCDLRDFRTDRIQKIQLSPEKYNPKDHPDFKSFAKGMSEGTDAKEAVVRFSSTAARFIQEQKYVFGFLEETKTADFVEMKFMTPYYEYLARWLLSFVKEVEIIYPSELQGLVSQFSVDLLEHHKKYFEVENPVT